MSPSRLLVFFAVVGALVAAGAWIFHSIAVYDDCLDRIDYDKARWHLCD